ncbi:MAG: hypothetical protein ABSC64_02270 [Candidatus Korobacteraceae bacterium]|jgi:hypothetical protein
MVRYYDISSRVQVVNLGHSVAIPAPSVSATAKTTVVAPTGASPTSAATTLNSFDRMGYWSWMLQMVLGLDMDAGNTVSLEAVMAASPDGSTWTPFTSTDSTKVEQSPLYKQLYLNAEPSATHVTAIPAGFVDQPYVYTAPTLASSTPTLIEARFFGSFRDANVVGNYVAPIITVVDTPVSTSYDSAMLMDVNLLLGAGDTMPVIVSSGAQPTSTYVPYYSQGQ